MITELQLKDIMSFYGCCKKTAIQRVNEIKSYFKIQHKRRILIGHLAGYEGLTVSEVLFILQGN